MVSLTDAQTRWFQGFWMYFNSQPRPDQKDKKAGWDQAEFLATRSTSGGGYA